MYPARRSATTQRRHGLDSRRARLSIWKAVVIPGHEQKQRRRHAAHKLRQHVRAAVARIQARKGVERVALDHDDHRQPAHPVEKGESFHLGRQPVLTQCNLA